MAIDGVIFDLDGTLVDTNWVHVEAWRQVMEAHGYRVAPDRIFIEIGKGGDNLVPDLLGKEADEKDGESMRKGEPKAYAKLAGQRGLKVFPGAAELLKALRDRGLPTVLATSSETKQLETTENASGLQVRKLVDEVVTADDAERSKPYPDIVSAAAAKLNMSVAQCVMVGDTPHDAEAAKHAGVVLLGVTCGGHEPPTLLQAGARATFRDPADILARLDEVLHLASPPVAHLTQKVLEQLMERALAVAEAAIEAGEVPIGCVLARGDGAVIASGFNELNKSGNPAAHAEMVTFATGAGQFDPNAKDLLLVSTLEPCVMCLGAAMQSGVDSVIYGLKAPADSGTGRVKPSQSPASSMPRIVGDVMSDRSRKLFERWLKRAGNNPKQVDFVKQLLSETT